MLNFNNKIKAWFGGVKKDHLSYEKVGIRPKKDWQIILSVTTILLFLLAFVAGYFYLRVDQGEIFNVSFEQVEINTTINKNLLNKTIGEIGERKKDFDAAKKNAFIPRDPSI